MPTTEGPRAEAQSGGRNWVQWVLIAAAVTAFVWLAVLTFRRPDSQTAQPAPTVTVVVTSPAPLDGDVQSESDELPASDPVEDAGGSGSDSAAGQAIATVTAQPRPQSTVTFTPSAQPQPTRTVTAPPPPPQPSRTPAPPAQRGITSVSPSAGPDSITVRFTAVGPTTVTVSMTCSGIPLGKSFSIGRGSGGGFYTASGLQAGESCSWTVTSPDGGNRSGTTTV